MTSSLIILAFAIFSLCTPLASAQDGSPSGTDMDKQLSQMQKDMNTMLQQLSKLRQQSQLQEDIHKMQSQIDKLARTTDPKDRQRLMQEHLDTLREHMKMIESMSESEGGSSGKQKTGKAAPAAPGRMIYGPGPMGYPGWMMYGPGMPGVPQGYPEVTRRSLATPPAGTAAPGYR
jgi:TolA-binding protein